MPLKFEVDFDDAASAELLATITRAGDKAELHEAMAMPVADLVRQHIAEKKKSPNTGFWSRVADSVTHRFDASGAVIEIPEPGAALHYHGGTVKQKADGPLLTLPTKEVPVRDRTRLAARDFGGLLSFLPLRRGKTRGLLVEGESYTRTRGKNKGKLGKRPKKGGKLFYVLRTETTHTADPSVLPSDQQIAEAARDGALDYVAPNL